MDIIQNQFEHLIQKFSVLVRDYKIPSSHTDAFKKFRLSYQNYEEFFAGIDNIECEVLPIFAENVTKNQECSTGITSNEIDDFLSGKIVVKTLCTKYVIEELRNNINDALLKNSSSRLAPKLLHLLSPTIVQLICDQRHLIVDTVGKLIGKSEEVSFEIGFFSIQHGMHSVHWHDDYTLFCNTIAGLSLDKRLLLNFHIALTDVFKASSPVCFLRGTENIVYARSAVKYFKDNNIRFDEELLLKATFLTENLYRPGEEIKANFIGLVPSMSYRMHRSKYFNHKLSIFYNELKAGQVQIFSPHLCHTSPFINSTNHPRESLVLRFFAGSEYNHRNIITIKDFIDSLSFATAKTLTKDDIQDHFFQGVTKLDYNSKLCFNLYLNKSSTHQESQYPKIYLEDLHSFFCHC